MPTQKTPQQGPEMPGKPEKPVTVLPDRPRQVGPEVELPSGTGVRPEKPEIIESPVGPREKPEMDEPGWNHR